MDDLLLKWNRMVSALQGRDTTFRPVLPWIFVLVYLWIALALIPQPPQILGTGLDASWAYALNLAHVDHYVFGRDVVFTFGPLGYLFYPAPGWVAPLPAFLLSWAVYAFFLLGLFLIWRALGCRLTVFVSWIILTGAMLFTDLPFERMQLSFISLAIGIVALLVAGLRINYLYLAVLGLAAGLTPLTKMNEGITTCALFYILLTLLLLLGDDKRGVWRKQAPITSSCNGATSTAGIRYWMTQRAGALFSTITMSSSHGPACWFCSGATHHATCRQRRRVQLPARGTAT